MKKSIMVTLGLGASALALGALVVIPQVAQAQTSGRSFPDAAFTFGGFGEGRGPRGGGHMGGPGGLIQAAAEVTGLSRDEIVTQLQGGQSLSQIVTAAGSEDAAVIAAARTALEEHLTQAVSDTRITQEQADQRLADFDANAPTWMTSTELPLGRGGSLGRGGHGGGAGGLIEAAVTVTGLTRDEIRTDLQAGQTLSQIVTEAGATDAAVIAAARTTLEERLTQAVTDGRLTQDQADQRLADFDAEAPTWMTSNDLGGGRGPCQDGAPVPAPTVTPETTS
jgi:DNA-binding FrmR family transcriptional regulator